MLRNLLFLAAATLLLTHSAAGTLHAADCAGGGAPLEIVNKSGREITGLYISQTGKGQWSANRLPKALAAGAQTSCDIGRDEILGLSDIRLTLKEGGEVIWRRLPILEIFSITVNNRLEPQYERIKLGS